MVGRDLKPSDHPKKDVRRVLEKWVGQGWMLRKEGHWGKLYCPCEAACTTIPISGSPQNEGAHARRVDRLASRCPLPPEAPNRSLTGRARD
ncbi:hypothetical protein E5082_03515 [Streptomyces griseoluteus]|uniref:Uncharacterized protein n=1 Tax=Streptomyces griseoluteus TaxID=29306 RepID=A0A4Z1DQL2_STRGP|nr:hypothetical protein E5082_03515 [Streptomyces griseoluteus]GHF12379.1 hypothetical protein GCM10017776_32740 [Streptomyces griseoluteus]